MSRFLGSVLGVAVLLVALPARGTADPPAAGNSTFDGPLVGVSPKNIFVSPQCQYHFDGTLRDANGVPVPNFPASFVVLDFSACARPSTRPDDRIPADGPSDANGRISWRINLHFSNSDPCSVLVRVQNEIFKVLPAHHGLPCPERDGGVRCPDANGDGLIALVDCVVFQQEFVRQVVGCTDYRGDLAQPFDGITSLLDLVWFQCHFVTPGE